MSRFAVDVKICRTSSNFDSIPEELGYLHPNKENPSKIRKETMVGGCFFVDGIRKNLHSLSYPTLE